jgi:predicted lipid-binding transport protein (Tim44 family)
MPRDMPWRPARADPKSPIGPVLDEKAAEMDGKVDLLTLLALVIAVVVIWKLRSVLGRHTADDDTRMAEKARAQAEARQKAEAAAAERGKVVTLDRGNRQQPQAVAPAAQQAPVADAEAKVKTFSTDPDVERGLLAILRADRSFDPEHFVGGSKQAYEMIVMAFAEGNRKMLKDLLSKEVFDGFNAAIADRESRGEQIDQSFVGINRADVVEADLKSGTAQITVKFVSQLISATRDRGGEVIAGDPHKIKEVTDIWSFAREVGSRNPNWRLVATQSHN